MHPTTNTYDGVHRILVVANETSRGSELHDLVSDHSRRSFARDAAVLVVAPAVNAHEAELRLCDCVESLRRRGVEAAGMVGDEDPIRAVEHVLHTFPADELIISTHSAERSSWLAHDVVARALERFALPTSHVEVFPNTQAAHLLVAA